MFDKAAGFIREAQKQGSDSAASDFYDCVGSKLVKKHAAAYARGFAKVAQTSPEDSWKPFAGAAGGALIGGRSAFKLSPLLVGKGSRARTLATLLGTLLGGGAGAAVARPSPESVDILMRDRSRRLAGDVLNARNLSELLHTSSGAAPKAKPLFSFRSGNPLLKYDDYMVNPNAYNG